MSEARTTIVRPADPTFGPALRLALGFAAVKLLLHIAANLWQAHIGYGYFRDELYYIACGRRLAWGYVDHGPGVAVQARLALMLFGRSLAGLRMFSALAGAAMVLLTGLLAWSLGGRRPAQGLAMIGVLVAPQYQGTDGYLSMNSMEPVFWMTCVLALVLLVRGGSERLWLGFGVSAGLGLLNKPSMTFFLAALLVGLLLTPQRRLLGSRWAAAGVLLLVVIALPNLLWQVHHHWATLEFLHNGEVENKNVKLGPLAFVVRQIMQLQPATVLVWGAGLAWLLRNPTAKSVRWLGAMYLVFLALMMAMHAKDYYVAPVYPILFAAGGIAWEQRFAKSKGVLRDRVFAFPVLETVLIVAAVLILPMAIPVLRPESWIAYTKAMHLYGASGNTENQETGALPQFYADRFGWQEYVALFERAYASLTPEERERVGLYADNYGEAGALDFLGSREKLPLPPVCSGHNNYYLWGSQRCGSDVVIAISGATEEALHREFDSVELVGRMESEWAMPYEHKNVYLLRHRRAERPLVWEKKKAYI